MHDNNPYEFYIYYNKNQLNYNPPLEQSTL